MPIIRAGRSAFSFSAVLFSMLRDFITRQHGEGPTICWLLIIIIHSAHLVHPSLDLTAHAKL